MGDDDRQTEQLAQFRTLLETSSDGFFINVEGRFHYVNPAFVRLLGAQSADELLGREVFDHIDPASHEAVRARIAELRHSTAPVRPLEERYVRVDGSLVSVEVAAVAIVEHGQHAMLVTVRDVSARKHQERAQRKLEKQLQFSQKMEALGTLAGGIAHDFNNILAAVVANAELMRLRLPAEDRAQGNVREILSAAQRATGVVRQILAFSRKQPARPRVIDLRAVILDELSLLRATAPAGVQIEHRLLSAPLPVRADATQMHQIVLNLCSNAWQALSGEGGRIVIGLDVVASGEGGELPPDLPPVSHAMLWVTDDGPGMAETVRQRVFDPFFTTKGAGGGTGLGLAVVHGIARDHGAVIRCESEIGRGTTFRLYLPLAIEAPEARRFETQPAPPIDGCRVLLLDDEGAVVDATAQLLRAAGCQVHSLSDPSQAVQILNSRPEDFDVLITDYRMPELTGLEVAERARQRSPQLPVVLLSGFLDQSVDQRAAALGVDAVLRKPVGIAELLRAIEGVHDSLRAARPPSMRDH